MSTTTCKHCAEEIHSEAKVCKHCGRDVKTRFSVGQVAGAGLILLFVLIFIIGIV